MNAELEMQTAIFRHCRQLSLSKDARKRISASKWELFFQLPLSQLIQLRDEAVAAETNQIPDDDEGSLAVNFSQQAQPQSPEKGGEA